MKLMRFILLLYSAIIFVHAHAQEKNYDSLQQQLQKDIPYKNKIQAYLELSKYFSLKDFDKTVSLADAGIQLAKQNTDSFSIAQLAKTKGTAFYMKGNFDSAAGYFFKAIHFFETHNHRREVAAAYNELARLYRKTKDYKRAVAFYDKAMRNYAFLQDTIGMATIYNESGVVYEEQGNLEEAARRYNVSLRLSERVRDSVGISYALSFLSEVFTIKKDFENAIAYTMRSMQIRKLLKDSFATALSYSDLGAIYSQQGQLDMAKESYKQSLQYALRLHYPDFIADNYLQLAGIAESQNDYKAAANYQKKYAALIDSIYQNEKAKAIEEYSAKYETAEKEKRIQEQQFEITKRNYWITGITAFLILGSLLIYSAYRRYKLKKEKEMQAAIMQQQELAAKAVLEAEENERKRIAGDLHDGVGQLMSAARMNLSAIKSQLKFEKDEQQNNFDKIVSLIDDSCNEVRTVSHNLMPNVLLKAGLAAAVKEFLDKIDSRMLQINFSCEGSIEKIDAATATVLYRVIQECLNNVIKHAGATHLDISLIKDAEGISATIEDNGKGFSVSHTNNFSGIGLKNIKSRIAFLKGTVEWDSSPGNGTLVAIHVPG